MQILITLKVLFLLMIANGSPVLAKDILGSRFAIAIDGGAKFADGRPVLGSSKTIRGIAFSILVTSALSPIVAMDWKIGALVASTGMAGDLLSSFLKRRMNLPAGSKATGLDQIPESLFPLLSCRTALRLTALDIVAGVVIFFIGELLLSRLLYHFHLRDRPY